MYIKLSCDGQYICRAAFVSAVNSNSGPITYRDSREIKQVPGASLYACNYDNICTVTYCNKTEWSLAFLADALLARRAIFPPQRTSRWEGKIAWRAERASGEGGLKWSPIRSIIMPVIHKIGRPRRGSPICCITIMITYWIGRHKFLTITISKNKRLWQINNWKFQWTFRRM